MPGQWTSTTRLARAIALSAGACGAVAFGVAGPAGCGRTNITQPLAASLATLEGSEIDEIEFWHELPGRTVVANEDALLGLIFLGTGGSASAGDAPISSLVGTSYAERVEYAQRRGWLAPDFDEAPGLAVRRGVIARALTDICRIKGGVMMQLLGPTERYSARELEYLGIMPPGSVNQVVTGGEFIGLISQAQDYINYKKLEPLPGVRAELARGADTHDADHDAAPPADAPADAPPADAAPADGTPIDQAPIASPPVSPPPATPPPAAAPSEQPGQTRADVEAPAIVVVFQQGFVAGPRTQSGVRLAVWNDGTTLIAGNPQYPATDMRVGAVSPEQVQRALADLERAGFFTPEDGSHVAPDAAFVRIVARAHGVTRTQLVDSDHQPQVAWWNPVALTMEGLRPAQTRPVSDAATDGAFRGYIVDEWSRTPWIR